MSSMDSKMKTLRNQDGAALIVTLMLLLALASMAFIVTSISSTDLLISGNDRQYQAALEVAEAGLAEAMHRMSLTPGTTVNVNGNDIDASIVDPADPPDPNWTARIFLTAPGAAPASANPSEFHTGTIQPAGDFLAYASATDPGEAIIIQHKMSDLDGDGVNEVVLYDPSKIPAENALTGQPIERITVRGENGPSSRTIMADVIRFPIDVNVNAALSADAGVDLRGNVTVCGHDHQAGTPTGTQLPSCSPNWDTADGHLVAVQTTGDPVTTQGSTDLLGSPTPTNTDATNLFLNIEETLGISIDEWNTIVDGADHYAMETSPQDGITIINGDVQVNGGTGSGLLYVTGDLEMRGNFSWRGLIYVEGNLTNTGNTWVLGGMVVRGTGAVAVDFAAGTPAVLYSRDMLTQALNGAMQYIVLNWKEI